MSVPMQRTPKAEYTLKIIDYQRRLSAGKLPSMDHESPRSHSSSLINTLNTMPAKYYQFHSAYRSRDRDDTIPRPVQRHLSDHLTTSTALSPKTLLSAMNQDPYINERCKILSRTLISHTDSSPPPPYTNTPDESQTPHLVARLQTLPTELLYIIRDMLEPAGIICLALTCRHLFHILDYQLIDLRNLLFINPSGHLSQTIYTHALEFRIRRQIYTITESLTRDRISQLILQELSGFGSGLTCSICITHHPRWYFSLEEMSKGGTERKCLASIAKIRFCDHWTENLIKLRALKKRQRSYSYLYPAFAGPGQICGHPDHVVSSSMEDFSAPRILEVAGSGGKWVVEREMTIVRVVERDELTLQLVRDVLKKKGFGTRAVCGHVSLENTGVVLAGLAKGARYTRRMVTGHHRTDSECEGGGEMISEVYWPEFENADCEKCGTIWRFSISDTGLWHGWPRYALKLTVVQPLVAVKDPWTTEWLNKVEGGEDLLRLKWQ